MTTYLFRNANTSCRANTINRWLDKLKNYPLIILFSFMLGFLASKADSSLPKMRVVSSEIERYSDEKLKEKKRVPHPYIIHRGH